MFFLFLLRLLAIAGVLTLSITQVLIPVWTKRPLFPMFRAKTQSKLEAQVEAHNQAQYEEYLKTLTTTKESK